MGGKHDFSHTDEAFSQNLDNEEFRCSHNALQTELYRCVVNTLKPGYRNPVKADVATH